MNIESEIKNSNLPVSIQVIKFEKIAEKLNEVEKSNKYCYSSFYNTNGYKVVSSYKPISKLYEEYGG